MRRCGSCSRLSHWCRRVSSSLVVICWPDRPACGPTLVAFGDDSAFGAVVLSDVDAFDVPFPPGAFDGTVAVALSWLRSRAGPLPPDWRFCRVDDLALVFGAELGTDAASSAGLH